MTMTRYIPLNPCYLLHHSRHNSLRNNFAFLVDISDQFWVLFAYCVKLYKELSFYTKANHFWPSKARWDVHIISVFLFWSSYSIKYLDAAHISKRPHPFSDESTGSVKSAASDFARSRPFSRSSSKGGVGATSTTSSRPPSAFENHIDYFREPVVKSPPEPTRVKSPEAVVRSPDPINWTVPLDTGKTFSVTQSIKDGGKISCPGPLRFLWSAICWKDTKVSLIEKRGPFHASF